MVWAVRCEENDIKKHKVRAPCLSRTNLIEVMNQSELIKSMFDDPFSSPSHTHRGTFLNIYGWEALLLVVGYRWLRLQLIALNGSFIKWMGMYCLQCFHQFMFLFDKLKCACISMSEARFPFTDFFFFDFYQMWSAQVL